MLLMEYILIRLGPPVLIDALLGTPISKETPPPPTMPDKKQESRSG